MKIIDHAPRVCKDHGPSRGKTIPRPLSALIVDPSADFARRLRDIVAGAGYDVSVHSRFDDARRTLSPGTCPELLLANVRLRSFNGIHLVYLAGSLDGQTRSIVYANPHDAVLAREAQRARAFYERQQFLPLTLDQFLGAALPSSDRRDPAGIGRRGMFRGGRRATDVASFHEALSVI